MFFAYGFVRTVAITNGANSMLGFRFQLVQAGSAFKSSALFFGEDGIHVAFENILCTCIIHFSMGSNPDFHIFVSTIIV